MWRGSAAKRNVYLVAHGGLEPGDPEMEIRNSDPAYIGGESQRLFGGTGIVRGIVERFKEEDIVVVSLPMHDELFSARSRHLETEGARRDRRVILQRGFFVKQGHRFLGSLAIYQDCIG